MQPKKNCIASQRGSFPLPHPPKEKSFAKGDLCFFTEVAFGIFLTELGVSSDEDAMVERTADSLCGALSRTVLRLTQAAAEFGAEELCYDWREIMGEMTGSKKELL